MKCRRSAVRLNLPLGGWPYPARGAERGGMIDQGRIAELRAELGDEDFAEIAALFVLEVEALIEGLAATPPGAELADALHRVRGSALNCGMAALAESCLAAETAQRRAPTPFCPIALHTLFRESVEALPELG